jgi:hypothetical protein
MKYFTPELIVMGQSKDSQVLAEQERLWEEAGQRYVNYLDSMRPAFPPGLRTLDESYYLHDAVVRSLGMQDRSFQIVLQLDTPPRPQLTLTYDLVEDPVPLPAQLPEDMRSEGELIDILYDEIERAPGEPATWSQSILLGNGCELQLHFRDVDVRVHRPFDVSALDVRAGAGPVYGSRRTG